MRNPPPLGTPAYAWWRQGAEDEAEARDEGLNKFDRDIRDMFVTMSRIPGRNETALDSLTTILWIFTSHGPLRDRLRLAWSLVKR